MPADPKVVEVSKTFADGMAARLIPWIVGLGIFAILIAWLRGKLDRLARKMRRQPKR